MDSNILSYVGHRLYQTERIKEMKRYLVFRARCKMHGDIMGDLEKFFTETPEREALLKGTPAFVEQVTRSFFYKGSTWEERAELVKNHVRFMEEHFTWKAVEDLYVNVEDNSSAGITMWEEEFEEKPLKMVLHFDAGQRKEGCLSLVLDLDGEALYQIMFWIGPDMEKQEDAIWIGALQGSPNSNDVIKKLTKAFFGYRTKNLIFYGIRNVARILGLNKIYAVTNDGYYAMNHIRMDRKLKTDFGRFWEECEGTLCENDPRFYVMPVEEYRKDMSELKPSKRANHRRRFARMDEMRDAFDKKAECVIIKKQGI